MKFNVEQTPEFEKWFDKQRLKTQALVSDRVSRLVDFGHLGNAKILDKGLFEFKWKNGLRVYFSLSNQKIILLIGGHKNGQKKHIEKSKKLKEKYL